LSGVAGEQLGGADTGPAVVLVGVALGSLSTEWRELYPVLTREESKYRRL
jgi:hypothetical protein